MVTASLVVVVMFVSPLYPLIWRAGSPVVRCEVASLVPAGRQRGRLQRRPGRRRHPPADHLTLSEGGLVGVVGVPRTPVEHLNSDVALARPPSPLRRARLVHAAKVIPAASPVNGKSSSLANYRVSPREDRAISGLVVLDPTGSKTCYRQRYRGFTRRHHGDVIHDTWRILAVTNGRQNGFESRRGRQYLIIVSST